MARKAKQNGDRIAKPDLFSALPVLDEFDLETELMKEVGQQQPRPFPGLFIDSVVTGGDAQIVYRLATRVLLEVLVKGAQETRGPIHHPRLLVAEIGIRNSGQRQPEDHLLSGARPGA